DVILHGDDRRHAELDQPWPDAHERRSELGCGRRALAGLEDDDAQVRMDPRVEVVIERECAMTVLVLEDERTALRLRVHGAVGDDMQAVAIVYAPVDRGDRRRP